MKRFYDTIERQNHFIREARSWLGTPFSENAAVRGRLGGVDCVHFAAEVHIACGALARISIPILPVEFVRSWHAHNAESRLLSFFGQPEIRSRLRRIEADDVPAIGDVAVIQYGKTEHHVALWGGAEAYQVKINAGVIITSTFDPVFRGSIRSFYRISE